MVALALSVALPGLVAGCGGSTTAPTPSQSSGVPSGPTFTITSSGVSPKSLTVTQGTQVWFMNNDSVEHEMFSDPHPEHTDCPEINQVGYLTPGQSRQTGNMNTVRSCGFHDHERPDNASLQGTIVIVP